MLEPVKLADSWRAIESELPAGWAGTHVRLRVSDPNHVERASALLAPLNAVRRPREIDVHVTRVNASLLRRQLARVDAEGIGAVIDLVRTDQPASASPLEARSLAAGWDAEVPRLPADWSDAYAEVELDSSDHLARAALLLAPCNPLRHGVKSLRFRASRRFGYGTSDAMVRRCLERLDEDEIRGGVEVLHVLSDTDPVHTQGPVWYLEGRSV